MILGNYLIQNILLIKEIIKFYLNTLIIQLKYIQAVNWKIKFLI